MSEIGFQELAVEAGARAKTDIAYEDAKTFVKKYEELRGFNKGKAKLKELLKKYWPQITAGAAAFGIPIGAAGPGSFDGILGIFGNFWPF